MSADEHRAVRELLGAYALGHLPPADEARLTAHLPGCTQCRAELAELLPVVRQLELLSPAGPGTPMDPPAGLEDRIAQAVTDQRAGALGHGRVRTGALVAATALVAAVVSALVVQAAQPEGPPLEAVAVRVETGGVEADAGLVAHTWGTEIKLTATGLHPGEIYRVWVVTGDGQERTAGEFVGTGGQQLHCNLSSGVLRPQAVGFVVIDDSGREVLASAFAG